MANFKDPADDALNLAVQFNITPVQRALYYHVATSLHLNEDGDIDQEATNLTLELAQRCKDILNQLIDHFTPILFTVATANHMACTDVFAEAWMPLVIGPALENNGLCSPIETLQTIMDLDWKSHGLCEDCVKDKRDEWRGEQEDVWEKLEGWTGV